MKQKCEYAFNNKLEEMLHGLYSFIKTYLARNFFLGAIFLIDWTNFTSGLSEHDNLCEKEVHRIT